MRILGKTLVGNIRIGDRRGEGGTGDVYPDPDEKLRRRCLVAAVLVVLAAPAAGQEAVRAALEQGHALTAAGRPEEAAALYEQTLEALDGTSGTAARDDVTSDDVTSDDVTSDDVTPELAALVNELAQIYHGRGEHQRAETCYLRALAMVEELFDADHPNVAASAFNLAILYHELGRLEDAESYYRRAVEIWIRVAHPLSRSALRGLATVYAEQGRYRALLDLLRGLPVTASPAGRDLLVARVEQAYRLAADQPADARDLAGEAFEVAQWAQAIGRGAAVLEELETVPLAEVGALLDDDEVLLAYLVAPERCFLWALRRDREAMGLADVPGAELEVAVRRRRTEASSPSLDGVLLEPVASYLDGVAKVIVIPDGPLVGVPFADLLAERPGVRVETWTSPAEWKAQRQASRSGLVTVEAPLPEEPDRSYWVQIASRPDRREAERDLAALLARHSGVLAAVPSRIVEADLGERGTWYRLQLGPYPNLAGARRLCAALAQGGHADCLVVKIDRQGLAQK